MKIDGMVEEILRLKSNIGNSAWLIGKRLNEIKDVGLYLERFGSWMEFLHRGVDISERSAQAFMRVSRNFDAEQVEQWGVSKCDILLTVEEGSRQEVMRIVSPSISRDGLKRAVSPFKADVGPPKGGGVSKMDEEESKARRYFLSTLELGERLEREIRDFAFRVRLCGDRWPEVWQDCDEKVEIEKLGVFGLVEEEEVAP